MIFTRSFKEIRVLCVFLAPQPVFYKTSLKQAIHPNRITVDYMVSREPYRLSAWLCMPTASIVPLDILLST